MMRNKLIIYIFVIGACLLLGRSIGNTAENDSALGGKILKNSISGTCFNDANANGRKDPGEKGIAAVKVTYKAFLSGSGAGTTQTNAAGKYEFRNLRSGIYLVEAKTPAGFTSTGRTVQVVFAFGSGTANFAFKARQVTTTTTTAVVSTTTTTSCSRQRLFLKPHNDYFLQADHNDYYKRRRCNYHHHISPDNHYH